MNKVDNNWTQKSEPNDMQVCFRCPHCQKLYKTSSDVFEGSDPAFDCSSCTKAFLLTDEQDSFGLFVSVDYGRKSFSTCPKCSGLKPHNADECPSCGVFASKYIELQRAESPVLFELNQQWQKVLQKFDNDQLHQDFINKCHLKLALNFAFQKYSDLEKTIGFDSLCEKYIRQIELRLEQQFKAVSKKSSLKPEGSEVSQLTLTQYLFISLGIIGVLLLIFNKFIPTFPNFNGFVFMLTLLAFGIGLFFNGKSDLKF